MRARARAGRSAVALVVLVVSALRAATLVLAIAIHPVLIGTGALCRFALSVAEVLLAAILIAPRRPLLPLLVFMSFLVGHEIPPRFQTTQAMCPSAAAVEPEDG